MENTRPTLHLLCGKIASGKSTLAKKLAGTLRTVLISEDDWLEHLFPSEINSVDDYVRCTVRLRSAIGPHVTDLLRNGVSVVLDFPANTIANRTWMKSLLIGIQSNLVLHFLDVPDNECLARLHSRNTVRSHTFVVDDVQFDLITSYFVAPEKEEGFNIVWH
jgi:predicted kinase